MCNSTTETPTGSICHVHYRYQMECPADPRSSWASFSSSFLLFLFLPIHPSDGFLSLFFFLDFLTAFSSLFRLVRITSVRSCTLGDFAGRLCGGLCSRLVRWFLGRRFKIVVLRALTVLELLLAHGALRRLIVACGLVAGSDSHREGCLIWWRTLIIVRDSNREEKTTTESEQAL